jgi:uncharacterized SAM-binding protein YcdF (DUF218 family)
MTLPRSWKRLALAIVALLAIFLASAPYLLSATGRWLMVADPLQHSRAVVVLGGQLPFRAMEAGEIYKAGWAPEVWLTQGGITEEAIALSKLGIAPTPEHQYSAMVLEKVGVPASAIRVLDGNNTATVDEMRTIGAYLRSVGGGRVILVTSKFHTRRVRAAWRRVVGTSPEAVVRFTSQDPFDAEHWWQNTADGMAVVRELGGLVNVWAGFPLNSSR